MQQLSAQEVEERRLAETLRNKGYLCLDYLNGNCQCPHCPYMHVTNGEERPVPEAVCQFFAQGKCLRERCKYFHGAQSDLNALRLLGKTTYRPQDFMKAAIPPQAARPAISMAGPQISLPNITPTACLLPVSPHHPPSPFGGGHVSPLIVPAFSSPQSDVVGPLPVLLNTSTPQLPPAPQFIHCSPLLPPHISFHV